MRDGIDRMMPGCGRPLTEDAEAGVFALGAAVAGDAEPDQRQDEDDDAPVRQNSAIAITTSAARATMKASAPPPLPSRRLAP